MTGPNPSARHRKQPQLRGWVGWFFTGELWPIAFEKPTGKRAMSAPSSTLTRHRELRSTTPSGFWCRFGRHRNFQLRFQEEKTKLKQWFYVSALWKWSLCNIQNKYHFWQVAASRISATVSEKMLMALTSWFNKFSNVFKLQGLSQPQP